MTYKLLLFLLLSRSLPPAEKSTATGLSESAIRRQSHGLVDGRLVQRVRIHLCQKERVEPRGYSWRELQM